MFDTAKIPAAGFAEDESDKLSSADIFGDIIQKIEKVPEFQINLGGEQPDLKTQPENEAPRQPDPAQTVLLKKEQEMVPEVKKPDPGKTLIVTQAEEPRPLPESRRHAATTQSINDSLDSLRQPVKKTSPENKMRKIEDDIARRFEDTLSGLGLQPKRAATASPSPGATQVREADKAPAAPEAKPESPPEAKPLPEPPPRDQIIVKEEEKSLEDEIIELGEESLQKEKAPEPEAEDRKITASQEEKPEEKPVPQDNPNEVGDYVLLGLIARGGMAEIYKAKKKGVKGFEKVIAIKKILSGYGEDDKFIEMLVDEAKIAAELSHPNIVQIYDLGRKDNYYFIAMEYVLGKDLREIQTRLRERDSWFPEEIALYLTIKILEALNYAHKAKDSRGRPLEIVHRDVSPPNILISYSGDVKLTDFGVSKASIKIHQTLSGALKGKLLYMSPEQARGESSIDFRSDLYSAGVLLFELLTGKKLFLDTTEMMVLKKVQNGEILNPREVNPDIDPALEKIILTSLNKDCDKRYQSAAAMIADLESFIHKKYEYIPGPVHLSHFIYGLFETDIHREGIKVDLKPMPPKPRPREIPKPQPPPEKPQPVVAVPAPPPPVAPAPSEPAGLVQISFDEDNISEPEKKPAPAPKATFKPESIFKETESEKKKFPAWVALLGLFVAAAAAGLYFFVFNKQETPVMPADSKPAVEAKNLPAEDRQAAGPTQLTGQEETAAAQTEAPLPGTVPAVTQKMLDEAKLKQEEDLKKLKEEEDRKKLLEEKRKKQAESDRLKKEEEDRKKQEEQARLLQEEADRKKQEEQARLKKEEDDRKKAEELKRMEQSRVKEGDILPMNDVDVQPEAISTPAPNIPATILSNMPSSQTLMFTVLINQNGDVETVRLLQKSNNKQLNTILTDLVKTWKYSPAQKNSVRVKVWKTVPLTIKK